MIGLGRVNSRLMIELGTVNSKWMIELDRVNFILIKDPHHQVNSR
jgi:hypothetical protein